MTIVKFQRGITTKLYRQKLRFLCSTRRRMMFYISMKFHDNILKGFQVIERTRNDHCQILKGNNYKMYRQKLQFLCSAICLMMLYISMKFHDNILNGFQIIERTRNYHSIISKGNSSKTV